VVSRPGTDLSVNPSISVGSCWMLFGFLPICRDGVETVSQVSRPTLSKLCYINCYVSKAGKPARIVPGSDLLDFDKNIMNLEAAGFGLGRRMIRRLERGLEFRFASRTRRGRFDVDSLVVSLFW